MALKLNNGNSGIVGSVLSPDMFQWGNADISPNVPSIQYTSPTNYVGSSIPSLTGNTGGMIGSAGSGSGYSLDPSKSIWDSFLGSTDANGIKTQGWGGIALGTLQGIGNAYNMGLQLNLAKKALQQSKDQFERNYAAQRQTTNASLEDRQRARVASNAGAYQSVGDYMDKYGIK